MCKYHNTQNHPDYLPLDLCEDSVIRIMCEQDTKQFLRSLIPIDIYCDDNHRETKQWLLEAWDVDVRSYILFLLPSMNEYARSPEPFSKNYSEGAKRSSMTATISR